MKRYSKLRYELLESNFVFNEVIDSFKNHLKKNPSSKDLKTFYKKQYPSLSKLLTEVSNKFDADSSFILLEVFLTNKTTAERNYVSTVLDSKSPISRGVYIKFSPPMNETDWKIARRQAESAYKILMEIESFKSRQDSGSEKDIELYKSIERKISEIYHDKKGGQLQSKDDSIVLQAIAEILPINAPIKELSRTKTAYYRVSRRFNLPTLKDLSKYQVINS